MCPLRCYEHLLRLETMLFIYDMRRCCNHGRPCHGAPLPRKERMPGPRKATLHPASVARSKTELYISLKSLFCFVCFYCSVKGRWQWGTKHCTLCRRSCRLKHKTRHTCQHLTLKEKVIQHSSGQSSCILRCVRTPKRPSYAPSTPQVSLG